MDPVEHTLRNLLAIIHGDGGHYVEKVGIQDAVEHAESMVFYMRSQIKGYIPISNEQYNRLLEEHFCLMLECTFNNPICNNHKDKYQKMKMEHSHIEGEDYESYM